MLKAVYYTNQFFAGLGGEELADIGLGMFDEPKGPAVGLTRQWKGEMEVVRTIYAGDNFINVDENFEAIGDELLEMVKSAQADVVLAGPAFNAGRYGVACAKVMAFIGEELGIPVVTSMWWENPAVEMYRRRVPILSSTETAAGMRKSLPDLGKVALSRAKGEPLGPARKVGYFPTDKRRNEYVEKTGAERVVKMLLRKLNDEPFITEVPLRTLDRVIPAPAVVDLSLARIALITVGGLVPKGNPDNLKQAFSVAHGKYELTDSNPLTADNFESIHGGYDTTYASADPHRLVPHDALLALKEEGVVGSIYPYFLTTCGIGTNVESSVKIGEAMLRDLKEGEVTAAILTST